MHVSPSGAATSVADLGGEGGLRGRWRPYTSATGFEYVVRLEAHDISKNLIGVDLVHHEASHGLYALTLASGQKKIDELIAHAQGAKGSGAEFRVVVECLLERDVEAETVPPPDAVRGPRRASVPMRVSVRKIRKDKIGRASCRERV